MTIQDNSTHNIPYHTCTVCAWMNEMFFMQRIIATKQATLIVGIKPNEKLKLTYNTVNQVGRLVIWDHWSYILTAY